ncbi:MAG: UPF0755 protein [Lysobacterales bacterium]|jgi:UPF0755 protein
MAGGVGERPMKRLIVIVIFGLALFSAVVGIGWQQYQSFLQEPLSIGVDGHTLLVKRGSSLRSVVRGLQQKGLSTSNWGWRLLSRLQPVTIMAGEYALKPGLTPPAFLDLLASGEVIRYRFTIIEGWTFSQLKQALVRDPVLTQELPNLDGDKFILNAIEAEITHPEGWFLPETYQYVRGDSDLDILRRSHQAMKLALDAIWEARTEDLPLKSPYELLTLASIVERESGLDSERAEIAGVFIRRLEQGWRLETDPTVIYGLGDAYDGDIRRRDLDTDTPYNTYTRFGLPPTPIALPGKSALAASAAPAHGTAMFFVASGSGGHVFSNTLDEHNSAVKKMLRRQK